jgi:hypothetical protein
MRPRASACSYSVRACVVHFKRIACSSHVAHPLVFCTFGCVNCETDLCLDEDDFRGFDDSAAPRKAAIYALVRHHAYCY